MFTAIDRLRTLKVSDVMAKNVFEVSANQSMEDVAKQFISHDISSAPVVNDQGHCVGMLSAIDYLKRDCSHHDSEEDPAALQRHTILQDEAHDSIDIVSVLDKVADYMTNAVQSIAADASLLEAASVMREAHIHRLPVLDGEQVVGIISTLDIVSAVLNAVDELDANQQLDF